MTKSSGESSAESRDDPKQDAPPEDGGYEYAPAGIRERDGSVPLWLILVIIGLLIWAVYYTVAYWSVPGPGS